MHRNKRKRKGFIMIFTLLNLVLIISCLFYMLNIEAIKTSRIKDCIKYELGENEYEKHREYLLSRFKKFILNNINEFDENNLYNFLNNIDNMDIKYENSYVEYDKDKKNIVLFIYPSTNKTYRREHYSVELNKDDEKKVIFKYLKTE